MRADLLHVVAVYSNPIRWESRRRVHAAFEEHMLDSGVHLTTVECAYGERPFELEDHPSINRVRVRAKTILWTKENLINIGISRLPQSWKYVAWIDADVFFRKPGWAIETVHALQHYDVVQPWSDAYDLGPKDEHLQSHKSFCRQLWHGLPVVPQGKQWWKSDGGPYDYAHSGYAWAATRTAIEWLGGLFELAAMGSGDHHMALAFVGQIEKSIPGTVSASYWKHLKQWQDRALHHVNGNLGFTWGTVEHKWHGRKAERKYVDRWGMILEHQFDPDLDLKRNSHGVFELAGNKPGLTRDLDRYFRERNEDASTIS
jgi:hypothetical protein